MSRRLAALLASEEAPYGPQAEMRVEYLERRAAGRPSFDVQDALRRTQRAEQERQTWIRHERLCLALPVDNAGATSEGVLVVLRDYASYGALGAALPGGIVGGGYFLYWRGRGIVVDPGVGFISAMRRDAQPRQHRRDRDDPRPH